MICMRCDQIFNFKKKLREHVREQHAKKFVKSLFLSIDTFESICEIEKTSFASFASQKSEIFIATSRQKFESVMIFETVNSSKNSHLTFNASEIVSESMKNKSNQCFFAQMFSFSRTLEIKHQDICVQKSSEFCSSLTSLTFNFVCEASEKSAIASSFFVSLATSSKQIFESSENRTQKSSIIDLFLSIDTVKSICESEKNSAVTIFKRNCFICRIDVSSVKDHFLESSSCNEALRHRLNQLLARRAHQREQEAQKQVELIEQEALRQVEVEKAISSSVSSICLNLSIATLKIVSKSLKSASNQEVTCVRMICKLCKQSFNFNRKLYEHIRKHEALKFVKNFHLSINAVNLVCEIEETSLVVFRTIILLKRSNLSSSTLEIKSESTKRLATCRRCNQIFNFNNKFHEHIRQHHVRKSVKSFDFRVFALESAYKFVEKLSVNCSFTSSFSSSQISVRNLHEFHIQKSHFIMNDLSRMFAEKFSSFDLQRHQSRRFSSKSFDLRQSSRSCFSTSTKSYFTIENLFEMFDEKIRKNNLFQSQKNVSFREFFSKQSRITIYFKLTINQKSSINRNSKSSKSKSLKQHTFAKFIRIVLFEKSFISSYKMLDIFDSNSMINCFKNEVFQISYVREILSRQFHLSSSSSDLSRCCRMCLDQFSFNNDSYRHLRMSLKDHTSRQSMRMMN